jgi:chitinase
MHIDLDGAPLIGSTSVAMTGDWQAWNTVSLSAGQHVLTIYIDSGEFNINWLEFAAQ